VADDSNTDRTLSVVMPCFNEEATVLDACQRVLQSPFCKELIVVDDASTDDSMRQLMEVDDDRLITLRHEVNQGKGAALRTGFAKASGPFVIVQDAVLEYDPADYEVLVRPLLDDQADVVYGSRFQSGRPHRVLYFWHSLGNKALTLMSNAFTNLNLTDMETGYKAFRKEVLDAMDLREDRFGIEPEITAKAAAGGWRIYEVGISYSGRTYAEGKKIGWRDGVHALVSIVRYSPLLARLRPGR
jgi:glycosyltransferase involved in cell wall biosynthesis